MSFPSYRAIDRHKTRPERRKTRSRSGSSSKGSVNGGNRCSRQFFVCFSLSTRATSGAAHTHMEPRRKMEFRRCLNRLSNQLSRQNLEDMKFVCKDHVPVARMERVCSSLDIFQALEERGKLSSTNTAFLAKVLISIERANLVSELVSAGFAPPDYPPQGNQAPPPPGRGGPSRELLFNEMLLKIAQNLSARDVESLTFTLCDSLLGMSADKVSSATQLFQLLQQRQIVTPTRLQALYNELENIGRSDLSKRINNYLAEIGAPPCQPGRDEGQCEIHSLTDCYISPFVYEGRVCYTSLYHTFIRTIGALYIVLIFYGMCLSVCMYESRVQGKCITAIPTSTVCTVCMCVFTAEMCIYRVTPDGAPANMGLPPMSTQTITPAEETHHPHMMPSGPPPPPNQAPQTANHYHHDQHRPTATDQAYQPYGVTEGGQPISSPSDTSGSSMMSPSTTTYSSGSAYQSGHTHSGPAYQSGHTHSGPASSQMSYPTAESHPSNPSTMRAQSGEHDHHVHHVSFVPSQVYPIRPKSGLSVAETGGQDVPLQERPLTLSFNTNEEEEAEEGVIGSGMSRMEVQDLQLQWSRTQELLTAKELERKKLHEDLEHFQQLTVKIMEEKEGESAQHEANRHQLESALQLKIDEIKMLQQQVQGLQQAPRPRSDMNPDEYYPLNKNPHGVCLIINNHRFYHETDPSKAHPDRGGAEIDQYNLTQTFRYLRYKVEVHENLTADQMTDTVLRMSQRDHTNYDSFVCCILSHGEHNIIHGANSRAVNIDDLTGVMKLCTSLRDKPKLFFIQCCRGEAEERGYEKDNPGDASTLQSTIPRDADFFLGYATPLGKAAYRSRRHGSWYISELCKVFTQYGYHNSLSSMMRRVNRQVSNAFTKDGYKQCAEFVDRLRSEIHFFYFIRNRPKSAK